MGIYIHDRTYVRDTQLKCQCDNYDPLQIVKFTSQDKMILLHSKILMKCWNLLTQLQKNHREIYWRDRYFQ